MEIIICFFRYLAEGFSCYWLFTGKSKGVLRSKCLVKDMLVFVGIYSSLLCVLCNAKYHGYTSILAIVVSSLYFYIFGTNKNLIYIISVLSFIETVFIILSFICSNIAGIIFLILSNFIPMWGTIWENVVTSSLYIFLCLLIGYRDIAEVKTLKKISLYRGISSIIMFLSALCQLCNWYIVNYGREGYRKNPVILIGTYLLFVFLMYSVTVICKAYESNILHKNRIEKKEIIDDLNRTQLHASQLHGTFRISHCIEWEKISKYLISIGIRCSLRGFNQLITAIIITKQLSKLDIDLNMDVYPEVMRLTGAKNMNTVINNIKRAIESGCVIFAGRELSGEYSQIIKTKSGVPGNKEFIFYVIEKMKKGDFQETA